MVRSSTPFNYKETHKVKPNLKVVADPARVELADAISEIKSAQRAADVASEAVELAQSRLRATMTTHARAVSALEEAQAPRKTLAEKLADARGDGERWAVVEEHEAEAARPAVELDDLKRLRAAADAADDNVVVARNALERSQDNARPTTSALTRAKDRRQNAVYEVVTPELARLTAEARDLIAQLSAKRAELRSAAKLTNPFGAEQRRAENFLGAAVVFPEEVGVSSDNDQARRLAALAGWAQFADRITREADAPFPS
jgi:chromosome segregation ATPase